MMITKQYVERRIKVLEHDITYLSRVYPHDPRIRTYLKELNAIKKGDLSKIKPMGIFD